ncbi:TonB-dependent receptor [Maribellus maritimus]|uniref:TonB-dependent receptor n=1 Tax=Maribellus maritimus TaxID=2870838 RepID=UPI001EEB0CA6|nr:TonB-dependent receptor [Maribellus maritimus]MCG6191424.1 TonB-dependent receptor [Maribellus maritimus]
MKQLKLLGTLLFLLSILQIEVFSQHIVSGFVYDSRSGEALINAHVYNKITGKGTLTNPYGFFSFKTNNGDTLQLTVSYVGYKKITKPVFCENDTTLTMLLEPGQSLDDVIVKAIKIADEDFTPAGRISFTAKQLEKIPGLLGEKDVIKSLQLMPGIDMGKEGSSGIYVRGGDRGQNLMLLDGMPVYNVNHLFGFFSVFTPEIVKSVDVYKGGFPARYSGRLSSVIDIRLKEGNLYKRKLDFTVGTISSKLIYESPIKKGKSSFILAMRRTYADLLYTPLNAIKQEDMYKTTKTWSGYNFYDINLKSNFILSSKDRLYFSIYAGRDKLFLSEKEKYNQRGLSHQSIEYEKLENRSDFTNQWGNLTLSSRWNHLFNEKLFSNTTISYSTYKYETLIGNKYFQKSAADTLNEHTSFVNLSEIEDIGLASDFDYFASPWLKILTGGRVNWRSFVPGKLNLNYESESNPSENFSRNVHETTERLFEGTCYIENHLNFFNKLFVNAGLAFLVTYNNGDSFLSLQPRIMANYKLSDNFAMYGSWTKMAQPLHLLVDNGSTFPVDMWVPSVSSLKPARSNQFDFGIKYNFNSIYEFTAEMYHKNMKNVVNYKNGESFFSLDETWYEKVTQGKGDSKGIEFLISKVSGKLNGWVAYSLSESKRQFDNLNNGKPFPFKYDSRHQLKVVGMYSPNKKIDLTGSWVYATGMPITLSMSGYNGDQGYARSPLYGMMNDLGFYDQIIYKPENVTYYNDINQEHLPAYHRLDIGINFIKQKRRGVRIWNFSVYNVYARNNPMMIFSETGDDGKVVYKSFSVFTFVPSVSYRFSFNTF